MKKSILQFLIFNLLYYCVAFAESSEDIIVEKPNIIIFLADDLGWGDLSIYGHSVIKTPNLDRFAKQGMLFTDCHSASAVCSPSRSAILTGRTPFRNGVYTIHRRQAEFPYLRSEEITLPELLKENGYSNCHVGKWHLGALDPKFEHPLPSDIKYDHWLAIEGNAKPSHLNPENFIRNGKKVGRIEGYAAEIIVDEAIDWLENQKPKQDPFFLTVWTNEPHTPIGTDDKFLQMYSDTLDSEVRKYYGNISQLDAAFGKLMTWLDENSKTKNTFVIFTSDNGPAWAPGHHERVKESAGYHRGAKAWLYEGGIRVPGIIRYPGMVRPASVSHAAINGTDFFPTILDLIGISLPDDRIIDGISILPVLNNKNLPPRNIPLYWRYDGADGDFKVAYREGDWILLTDEGLDKSELYNLSNDWQQRHNLVYTDKYFSRYKSMKKNLIELHDSIEKEGPSQWWKKEPDPLWHWKRTHPEAIKRLLLGKEPPGRPCPYNNMKGE
jgi:arylsulfatase A